MIATASLTNPYPKTIEKSLGYSWGLIIVNAATASEAQMVALNLTTSVRGNLIDSLKLLHFLI